MAVEPGGVRGCLRCRWVLSGWIFGWWGHLVPRLGQTIAQAELRRLPGSGGSWLAWVGWHRPSRVSPQLRLTPPQACSAPSDTSRDSQFESASTVVASVRATAEGISPRHFWQKMGAMASTGDSTHVSTLHSCTTPLHLVPCANLVRRVTLNLAPASWSCRLLRCRRS